MKLGQTPSQTVGPFFSYGLVPEQYGYAEMTSLAGPVLALADTPGQRIRIEGRVLDGQGAPIPDALIEIWQADASGRYAHPADPRPSNAGFKGFGRCGTGTDPECRFWFETIKPGSVDGLAAPHVNVVVMMRGLLVHAFTRIYFADEPLTASDPVLQSVPAERRATLIASPVADTSPPIYRLDISMQGDRETVFFDV